MEPGEYQRMFDLEDRYWWFLGRRALVRMLIEEHVPRWPARVLDVGCGTGGMSAALPSPASTWVGMDRSELALGFCRKRKLSGLVQATAEAVPVRSGYADLLLCLDVLYHRNVHDEAGVLGECFRVMAPNGTAIITDSALNWLRGPHDAAVHTRRRYQLGELTAMVERAGFEIVRRTYANSLLLAPMIIHRFSRRLSSHSGEVRSDVVDVPAVLARALSAIQALERWLLRRMSLPIGWTVVIVARKP